MADKPIVIDNFQAGIAQSSAFGFEQMVGIDINTNPGYARVGAKLKLDSGTTISDTVNWIVKDGVYTYALADNGKLYKRTSGTWAEITGTTGVAGSGLAIYKGYLFNFEGLAVEILNLTSGAWVTSPFGGIAMPGGGIYGYHTLIGQDDILYVTGNNFIVSFAEVDGKTFNPADNTTYTVKYTASDPALDLPDNYDIVSLSELGNMLVVAANNRDTNRSDLFPWDRVSVSFELPIRMGMNDIHAAIEYDNYIYFIAGVEGSIYRTNGVGVEKIATIPDGIINRGLSKSISIKPAAICVFKNLIYFANSYSSSIQTSAYIWSLNPRTGALNIEHTVSTGVTGTGSSVLSIDCLFPYSDTELMVGFKDSASSVQGVDILDTTRRYTGYTAYMISALYRVGTRLNPRSFTSCEIELSKPLATGEGIKVEVRTDKGASWRTVGTFDTAGASNYQIPYAGKHSLFQAKISMTTPAGSESSPELVSVTFV